MTHNANIQSQNFGYISIFMLIYTFLETTKKIIKFGISGVLLHLLPNEYYIPL